MKIFDVFKISDLERVACIFQIWADMLHIMQMVDLYLAVSTDIIQIPFKHFLKEYPHAFKQIFKMVTFGLKG